MLHNLKEGERVRIKEASNELIEPFKKVVAVAMQRVREGTIDSSNRQMVMLSDDVNNREYNIIDVSVYQLGGVVMSTRFLDGGLFIEAFQLEEKNKPRKLFSIQLPRDPDQVNKESLYLQRGSIPNNVKMLAAALSSARKL